MIASCPHMENQDLASPKMTINKDDTRSKCHARLSDTFSTDARRRVVCLSLVPWVKFLSLACQFIHIHLGNPQLTLVLER
jgi:hypothetical protein